MMGSNDKPQNQLFYSFNLDEVVPEDHLLRHIEEFLLTAAAQNLRRMAKILGTGSPKNCSVT